MEETIAEAPAALTAFRAAPSLEEAVEVLRAHVTRVMYMDAPAVGRPVFEAQPAPELAPEWAGHGPALAHGEPGDRGELYGPECSDGGYLQHPLVPGQVTANLLVRPGLVFHH